MRKEDNVQQITRCKINSVKLCGLEISVGEVGVGNK